MAGEQLTEWQADGAAVERYTGFAYQGYSDTTLAGRDMPGGSSVETIRADVLAAYAASTMTFAAAATLPTLDVDAYENRAGADGNPRSGFHYAPFAGVLVPAAEPLQAEDLGTDRDALLAVAPHLSAADVLPLVDGTNVYVEWEQTAGPLQLAGGGLTLATPQLVADTTTVHNGATAVSSGASVSVNVRAVEFTTADPRPYPAPTEGLDLGTYVIDTGQASVTVPVDPFTIPDGWAGAVLILWSMTDGLPALPVYVSAILSTGLSEAYAPPRYKYRPRALLDERREARATVSGVLRDLYSIDVRREIATVLPEQVAGGGGILSGSCKLELAEDETVTVSKRGPWDRANGSPIATHETVEVDVTTVGDPHRVFTGRVESVGGAARAQEVRAVVRDDARWLDTEVNHQALLAAMPPVNAGVQRQIGLRPDFLVDRVFRQGGFYATPPREAGSVLSVPAQGTLWPEGKSATDPAMIETSTLVPAWHPAPWGWSFANVTATYRPTVIGKAGTDRVQIQVMAAPDHAEAGFVEVYLTGTAYTIRVTVNADRTVTAALAGSALTRTWAPPAGWEVVELRVAGTTWTLRSDAGGEDAWTAAWPAGAAGASLGTVRVVAGAYARLGAFQVALPAAADPAFQAVGYTRTATLTVGSLFGDLTAVPAVSARDGLDLLGELSEAMVASLWVDETGHIFWVHPDRLRDQPPALTLTSAADLLDLAWEDHADAARASVTVHALTPNVVDTGGVNIATATVSSDVSFAPEQWALTAAGESAVDAVLDEVPGATPRLLVSGHTDNLPNTSGMTNQELSERRAASVRAYILAQRPAASVETRGYGDTRPVATNATAEGRAANRRVEIAYSAISETEGTHREYAVTVYEGPGDTTNAGDVEERILTPGFRQDWIMPAPPVGLTPTADLGRFNQGLGSWVGALAAYADGTEAWVEGFAPVTARLAQIGPAAWKLTETTSAALSLDAAAVAKVADDARLAPSRRGDNLPVIRAKARIDWEPTALTSTVRGPAHHPRLEHDAGPWVHGPAAMTALADWIAGQVVNPPAVLRELPIAYRDDLRLGMVIDVAEEAVYHVTLRLLVTGLGLHVEDGSADMTVTGRIVAVVVGGYGPVYELTYPQAQE